VCCVFATTQIHADFLPAWNRLYTNYTGQSGGGIVYDGTTGLVLPPWRGGTGGNAIIKMLCRSCGIYSLIHVGVNHKILTVGRSQ
jgi:hypothetical protein